MNTPEFLLISSSICPDREAIIFEGNRWSFSDLADRSNRLANALAGMGVGQGDKVGMLQVNCNECIEVYFATAKLGATYVPLNFRARAEELEFMINFSEASALFLGQRYVKMINSMREQIPGMKNLVSVEGPAEGMLDYESVIAEADPEEVFTDIDDNDTSILMFTAGTTGQPKGVMLTHDNLATYVLNNVSPADPDIEEKNILTVPLYHIAGMQAVLAAVYGGRTLVVQRQFEPSDWMTLVESESVTRAMMVPTMLKQLMEHEEFPERNLSSSASHHLRRGPHARGSDNKSYRGVSRHEVYQCLWADGIGVYDYDADSGGPRYRGFAGGEGDQTEEAGVDRASTG